MARSNRSLPRTQGKAVRLLSLAAALGMAAALLAGCGPKSDTAASGAAPSGPAQGTPPPPAYSTSGKRIMPPPPGMRVAPPPGGAH